MKFLISSITIPLIISAFSFSARAFDAPVNCTPFGNSEQPFERDYKFLNSKEAIDQDALATYQGEHRLKGRAYWDQNQRAYVLPYSQSGVPLTQNFIKGLSAHFAKALENRYADAIIYPDMGHAHLVLPTQEWIDTKKSTEDMTARVNAALASPRIKALYHTAEMVHIKEGDFAKGRMPQDPWKLWRYFSRNLLGSFESLPSLEVLWAGPKAVYNTVREVPSMTEVTTVYFVAHKSGCFPFKAPEGEKFFDITFETIPYKKN
ncbi:hypothetical protein AZI86_01290 [Bdellovibrio bacteriovorus]|uniref:Uncharacterized protein n=1 Tax=Bdellovibrio bacteriovorus TaxID=959 RepID=A0A150WMX0_BDEBC|nr:hypothetical protein [Bdellovibrio bacteriovorus]KYG65738.1 hypothetical protein AZI86_01290 [Bdellovibrio bacteriovorus]